jgi:hypothetical protein
MTRTRFLLLGTVTLLIAVSCISADPSSFECYETFDDWSSQIYLPEPAGVNPYTYYWTTDVEGDYHVSMEYYTSPRLWNCGGIAKDTNIWRNFRIVGLGPTDFLTSPILQADMCNGAGLNTDPTMWSRLWLKDDTGNGYMGRVNRPGAMEIYRVTNGTLILLAANNGSQIPDGDHKTLKLSAVNGTVTLSFQYPGDVRFYSLSANDATYTGFTTIGAGGNYNYIESHTIDNVIVYANPLTGTSLNYTESFNNWPHGYYLPTTFDASYWYCDVAGNYWSSSDWSPSLRLWNCGELPRAKNANCWRDFRASGELSSNQEIYYPVLQALMWNGAGYNDDASLSSRLWLKDENGNGYMGRINRPGTMEIYRIDNGVSTQIASSNETQVPDGDAKIVKLAVANGIVTLSFQYSGQTQVYSLEVNDTSYTGFTLIGLGGQYGWSESHSIDDISLNGVILSNQDENVTVDLSVNHGAPTYRASGFLHGFSTTEPIDDLITPLKITNIRYHPSDWTPLEQGRGLDGAFDIYDRARGFGIDNIQCTIADDRGYFAPWPGDNGDWASWETLVQSLVTRAMNEGKTFHWDIWNEPNAMPIFGKSDPAVGWAQFLETWRRAVVIIRSIDPSAVIVGPSLAGLAPNYQYINSFLIYAQNNNVLPDILSWHDHYDIMVHLNYVRGTMAAMGIPEIPISINEYTDKQLYTNPGWSVQAIATFDASGVASAGRTMWEDPYSPNNWIANAWATDHTLNAILKPVTFEKRPTWWVYKGYADITGQLVGVSGSPSIGGIAGYDAVDNTARVLLGKEYRGDLNLRIGTTGTNVIFTNMNSVPNLSYSGRVHVQAYRIPNMGWEALAAPIKTVDGIFSIVNNQLIVRLPNLRFKDAYTIEMTISSLAFSNGFESGNFTAGGWSNSGCDIQSTYKYAGTYAAQFNSSDSLTKAFSTAGKTNIQVSYARYTRSCESDDHFICEWSANGGSTWNVLEDVTGNSSWTERTFTLPVEAANNPNFRIRFRTSHNGIWDYAYLDELKIVGDSVPGLSMILLGDANSDGMVDVGDLGILAANYGQSDKTWIHGDFNDDGVVDVGDLGILAAHYGEGASTPTNFSIDYAKTFGTTVSDDTENDAAITSSMCGALGLPLIAGLALMGLMLTKVEE